MEEDNDTPSSLERSEHFDCNPNSGLTELLHEIDDYNVYENTHSEEMLPVPQLGPVASNASIGSDVNTMSATLGDLSGYPTLSICTDPPMLLVLVPSPASDTSPTDMGMEIPKEVKDAATSISNFLLNNQRFSLPNQPTYNENPPNPPPKFAPRVIPQPAPGFYGQGMAPPSSLGFSPVPSPPPFYGQMLMPPPPKQVMSPPPLGFFNPQPPVVFPCQGFIPPPQPVFPGHGIIPPHPQPVFHGHGIIPPPPPGYDGPPPVFPSPPMLHSHSPPVFPSVGIIPQSPFSDHGIMQQPRFCGHGIIPHMQPQPGFSGQAQPQPGFFAQAQPQSGFHTVIPQAGFPAQPQPQSAFPGHGVTPQTQAQSAVAHHIIPQVQPQSGICFYREPPQAQRQSGFFAETPQAEPQMIAQPQAESGAGAKSPPESKGAIPKRRTFVKRRAVQPSSSSQYSLGPITEHDRPIFSREFLNSAILKSLVDQEAGEFTAPNVESSVSEASAAQAEAAAAVPEAPPSSNEQATQPQHKASESRKAARKNKKRKPKKPPRLRQPHRTARPENPPEPEDLVLLNIPKEIKKEVVNTYLIPNYFKPKDPLDQSYPRPQPSPEIVEAMFNENILQPNADEPQMWDQAAGPRIPAPSNSAEKSAEPTKFCEHCFSSGEPAEVYKSHSYRDNQGNIVCLIDSSSFFLDEELEAELDSILSDLFASSM